MWGLGRAVVGNLGRDLVEEAKHLGQHCLYHAQMLGVGIFFPPYADIAWITVDDRIGTLDRVAGMPRR